MIHDKLYIRSLTAEDLDAILELQEKTILGLKDRTVLRKNSPEIILQSLSSRNIAIGVFFEKELVAIGFAVDPIPPETDLRANLQNHVVDKAMDLKLIIVKEEYRGNGLQRALICLLEKLAYYRGFTDFCTSVSPNNSFSINNVIAMGYEYDHQEELYGGLLRNVYVKKLKVIEFNSQLISAAHEYEGDYLPSLSINASDYIHGDLSLCSTGDIAEFLCEETGRSIYGVIFKTQTTLVLLRNPDGMWESADLDSEFSKYKLQRILLNVKDKNPFAA